MLRIPTDGLRPGMKLGKTIYTGDGRVLLQRGTELRENYLAILKRLSVPGVYVVNETAPDVEPMDIISDQARQTLGGALREAAGEMAKLAQKGGPGRPAPTVLLPKAKLKQGVDMIVTDLIGNRSAVVSMSEMRTEDDFFAGHSVSVAALAVLAGLPWGLTVPQLHELGLGAALHDIGKAAVAPELLQRTETSTPEEAALLRQHPTAAWEVLSRQSDISFVSAAVPMQHHERFGGGGYPRGVKGSDIHQFARITAVADLFDVLVCDIGTRRGFHPARAIQKLAEMAGTFLDPEVVKQFIEGIAPFPVGSLVQVTGGYEAVVTAVERGKTRRPKIRLLRKEDGTALAQTVDVDLSVQSQMEIRKVLQDGSYNFAPEAMT